MFLKCFWRIAEACAQTRICKKPIKTYGFPRLFVGRAFLEKVSAVERKSMLLDNSLALQKPIWRPSCAWKLVWRAGWRPSCAWKPVWRPVAGAQNGKLRLERRQVALGERLDRPPGAQNGKLPFCSLSSSWSCGTSWQFIS